MAQSVALETLSDAVGWLYFTAWSISFYPQIVINYRRKSVSGLSFDFLALNMTGFLCYGIFNIGLFCIPYIQVEYRKKHRNSVWPVQANDVFFAIHAICLTAVQVYQCVLYPANGQRLFRLTRIGLGAFWLLSMLVGFFSAINAIAWLDCLYFFSYAKLGITLFKYFPQVWMNYCRKSTIGWSIENTLLDFAGGTFSLIQLFIQAYNFGDWSVIAGNPTKFGLGLLSIVFDTIFMAQHYVLYDMSEQDRYASSKKHPVHLI